MINFDIRLTFSKLFAILVLGVAAGLTHLLSEPSIIIAAIPTCGVIVGIKTHGEHKRPINKEVVE